jgi:hypothetical protein
MSPMMMVLIDLWCLVEALLFLVVLEDWAFGGLYMM